MISYKDLTTLLPDGKVNVTLTFNVCDAHVCAFRFFKLDQSSLYNKYSIL